LLGVRDERSRTVVKATWSEVTIEWDDGLTASIQHNDMANVERVPTTRI